MASDQRSSGFPLLKATIVAGVSHGEPTSGTQSVSATPRGVSEVADELGEVDVGGTLDAGQGSSPTAAASVVGTSAGRTTVLPRRSKQTELSSEERPRFAHVRSLGQGAMGQVDLARDNDIRRTVAVKRLLSTDADSDSALLRFADEVRVVGQLEHPGIVPVYDVGRDADGQVYLVMKHLHGETMEQILKKLRAGEASYRERFSPEFRVHVFLGVLDAIRYAHARGILHRDLKPANIMIGPFGEVTVMDWGIAKPFCQPDASRPIEPLERTLVDSHDQRLLETQFGSLAGTPLYMSPEQACGHNDDLDERSDVYALCVLFFEWLVLEHPLKGKTTVTEVLSAIISHDYHIRDLAPPTSAAGVPIEYTWVALKGMQRDKAKRYQSVAELEDAIKRVLEGHIRVSCHVTLTKRAASEFVHWIDRNSRIYDLLFLGFSLCLVSGIGYLIWRAVMFLSS